MSFDSRRPVFSCRALTHARLTLASRSAIAVAAALAIVLGAARALASEVAPTSAHLGQDPFDDVESIEELRALERAITDVAARVRPSVVALRWAGARGGASGTAVIISKDGLLATCGHVGRRPGRELTAVLADGTELRGRTLGQVFRDGIDCGLVQLETDGHDLPAVPMGSTEGLAPGDWLVALGYTHGLGDTVRPSLLRAGRVLLVGPTEIYFDAPIDAGDSGGPSFNLRGEVVGLNARCGRLSWQNVATRIDVLSERLETLKAQVRPEDQPEDAVESRPARSNAPVPKSDASGKAALATMRALQELADSASATVVRIHCDGRSVAYGTIIDASGLLVTKASQLVTDETIEIERDDGSRVVAHELARDSVLDVALLRMEPVSVEKAGEPLQPVSWATDVSVAAGTVVVTPRGVGRRARYGFAAIEERESALDAIDGPYLGVQTRPSSTRELRGAGVDRAVTIVRVIPETAAARAGLEPGQVLLTINDTEIGSPDELRRTLRRYPVGASVTMRRVVGALTSDVDVTLGRREASARGTSRGNTATPISARSSGFGALLPHDTVTEPSEMGGPIIDLDGCVVGMNIARFDRTATHAIGAKRMAEVCERLMEEGRAAGEGP